MILDQFSFDVKTSGRSSRRETELEGDVLNRLTSAIAFSRFCCRDEAEAHPLHSIRHGLLTEVDSAATEVVSAVWLSE